MNSRIGLLVVFITTSVFSLAQVNPQFLQDPTQYGKTLEANTGDEIRGNPYYSEGWSKAVASVIKGGAAVSLPKVRYNVLREQLEFDNGGKMMFLDPMVFSQFIMISGTDSVVFRNKIEGVKSVSPNAYFNVVYEGKNLWLIKPLRTLVPDPEATYGSTKKKLIQSDESFFLIKSNREVVSFKMTTRSLAKSFALDAKRITDFLNSSGYSLEQPKHYQHIFEWLDSQL